MFQVGHHLREIAYVLYKNWFKESLKKNEESKKEYLNRQKENIDNKNGIPLKGEKFKSLEDEKAFVEYPHPGEMKFEWFLDIEEKAQDFEILVSLLISNSVQRSITEEELENMKDIDQLYLVKWKSLSYQEITWEPLSLIKKFSERVSGVNFNYIIDKRL